MPSEKENQLWLALKKVIDPELGINIVDLGLVYQVYFNDGRVGIEMTLTSPGCPLAPIIDQMIKGEVGPIEGVREISINLIWDPPWTMDMISEEARAELGMD
jgi:metal-sulfur cluster biosynthetic enzyme